MARLMMQMALLSGGKWTGEWSKTKVEEHVAPTLQSLRASSRYWVISDAQLARDLKGRTLADVYRDNHTAQPGSRLPTYRPRGINDRSLAFYGGRETYGHGANANRTKTHPKPLTLAEEYAAWCEERGHTPHPASLDRSHPINAHIEKAPRVERITP